MKHVCFSLAFFFLVAAAFSQGEPVKTVKTKPAVSKPATLKTPAENKVIEKIPDLKIVSANVVATPTGPGAYKLTITCTIKNEGFAIITQDKVGLQGYYAEEADAKLDLSSIKFKAAGGVALGSSGNLNPGASATTVFYSFNPVFISGKKYVYVLLVKPDDRNVKELSSENNRLDIPIVFQ
jgi:hypothetical protein